MSRLYETLRRMEKERRKANPSQFAAMQPLEVLNKVLAQPAELEAAIPAKIQPADASRLVSLTDPRGLAAERFRALVTRLESQRKQRDLKSLQVTSAVSNEGKTLVSGNLAVTLAKHTGSRVLVIEGDLHRPALASLYGLGKLGGIGEWWTAREDHEKLASYLRRLDELSLWFLGAGTMAEQPSHVLQSARFAEAFVRLASLFDWVVVDSAPILAVVDANLWSRLVDGTLVVVREGVTPIRALKQSLESLDNPKLAGMVLNETVEFDATGYTDQYYGLKSNTASQ
jgi:protein-tyrosine kinase